MTELIGLVLKIVLPFVNLLFQRAQVSDQLKKEFFEFVRKYNKERSDLSSAKEAGQKQDDDLDNRLNPPGAK